jgi:prepilin-type N-terminal cleavage/methylation domain-containing protein/prepilin-type processing-associated H-X9-DG protein
MKKTKGFTLIELLVVIAIIAMLLAVIVPSLKLAKLKATSIICLTNAKNLSLGWFSYKEDNNGRIMSANMDGVTDDGGRRVPGWIGTPRDASGATKTYNQVTPEVTDEDEIRGIEAGALHPYVKAPKAYTCPADKVKSLYDQGEKFVTFAIPTSLYGFGGTSTYYKYQIKLYSEITSPSDRYNFVETAEERNFTVSGHFVLGAPEYRSGAACAWWGPMAVNHGDSSILGFCDGHAEIHKWQDPFTKERVSKLSQQHADLYNIEDAPAGQQTDIRYMGKGWAYRYKN